MRLAIKNILIAVAMVALIAGVIPVQAQPAKQPASKSKSAHHKHRGSRKGAWKRHGQQKIDAARATEIQQALIREKYLDGAPNGKWDTHTEAAMARYQADNGWQSKVTPDSRALIKLGLGPNHQSDLQNPDTKPGADSIASTVSSSSTGASKRQ